MGPTWGPPGADRTKVGPMLGPWPLLSGTWWRHEMETFSALLAICVGNSPVPVNSPHKPVTRSFDVFFDLRLNKRLNKQSWGWWFETLSRSSWRHCNGWYSTCSVTSHYLKFWANSGLLLITEHFRFQWNSNQNTPISIQDNWFEMSFAKSRPFCLDLSVIRNAYMTGETSDQHINNRLFMRCCVTWLVVIHSRH